MENMRKKQSESIAEINKKIYDYLNNQLGSINERIGQQEKRVFSSENMKKEVEMELSRIVGTLTKVQAQLKPLNERIGMVEEQYGKLSGSGAVENIDTKAIEEINKERKIVANLSNEYKNFAEDVSKRIISIENIRPMVEKRIEELTKTLQPMIKKEMEPMEKKIRETRLDEVNRILTDVITKIAVIENRQQNLNDKITKPEIYKEMENIRKKQSEYLAETDKKIYEYIDTQLETVNKKVASVDTNQLIGRINSLTDEYKNFAGDMSKKFISIENIRPMVEKRIEELTKTLQPMIKKEMEPFSKRNESLENKIRETRFDDVNKIITDFTIKIAAIENKVNLMEKDYGKKIAEVPKMQEKVIIREPRFLEEQFKEVVNRMIFLESRLIAVEGMVQEKSRALPIIIE
jgi:hypothetical protein